MIRNGSSNRTQFLPKRPKQLRSGYGGTFWPSSAPRIDFRGVQTSKLWTINWGLFWSTWHAESATTAWRTWGDPLRRWRQRSPCRRRVRRQQSGRSVSRLASRHMAAILSDIIVNECLKLLQTNYLPLKVYVSFNFPSRSHCTCNRTYGKTQHISFKIPRLKLFPIPHPTPAGVHDDIPDMRITRDVFVRHVNRVTTTHYDDLKDKHDNSEPAKTKILANITEKCDEEKPPMFVTSPTSIRWC